MLTIEQHENQVTLKGELSLRTITKGFEKKSLAMLSSEDNFVNLLSVHKVDTAGLAWLLMMLEQAKKKSLSIKFTNISQELLKLAKLSAVDSFLPID